MTQRTERILNEFLELVQIDCGTRNERPMADALKPLLTSLGCTVEEDDAGETIGGNAGNLIARLPGDDRKPTILLCAHMDRVTPGLGIEPVIEDGIIKSKRNTILAADDVAGIAAIIEGVRRVREDKISHPPLEIVFTIAEEGGLNGAKACNIDQLYSKMGFFLDSNGPVGTIIVQAPFQNSMEFVITGKASHAGVSPELGINALQVAAKAVAAMNLGRIDEETTANIGVFESGSVTNIVPDRALLKGEARSLSEEKLKAQTEHMLLCLRTAAAKVGAGLEEKVVLSYPGYKHEATTPVVAAATEAAEKAGLEVVLKGTGGGSDANIFNGRGIPSIVLGMGYTNVHSTDEAIPVRELERSAQLVYALLGGLEQ